MEFQLRNATGADWDFIWDLRVSTMKRVISESSGWDEPTQRTYAVDSLLGQIVLVDGQPVGVLTLSDWCDQLHVTWMAVCPSFQGRGLGSALIAHCQRLAAEARKPLTLQVLRKNPAVRLYERCGFQVCGQDGPEKMQMQWSGDSPVDVGSSVSPVSL